VSTHPLNPDHGSRQSRERKMSLEEVTAFSNAYNQQNIQDAVPAWLRSTHTRLEATSHPGFLYGADSEHPRRLWNPIIRQELDLASTNSLDDDVSVTDSAHDSWSSESSSQTSYTTVSDSSDSFPDDDNKDFPSLSRVNSYPPSGPEEQTLRDADSSSQANPNISYTSCPISNAIRSVKSCISDYKAASRHARSQQVPASSLRHHGSDANISSTAQSCGSRRSAWSFCKPCPPKLKRDTDGTEQFVALLIIFAKRLITAIWPLSDRPPMMTDCFNGAGVLPLEAFIRETLRRSKTSFSTLQVALYYLILLRSRVPEGKFGMKCGNESPERAQCRAMQCGRRMFLSALMLASKYLQDRNYSARAWSKISGLRSNEINENEREYLAQINYDLHLSKETFENWSKIVLVLSKLSNEGPQSRPGAFSGSPGSRGGSNSSLAAMLSQLEADEKFDFDNHVFTDVWWSNILQKLEPSIVKETPLVDGFLRENLPLNQMHVLASLPHLRSQVDARSESNDMNFSETCRSRNVNSLYTPQTPVQMSPARSNELPTRPFLGNLPTPQTTPRIPDQYGWDKTCSRLPLRCAASMDAMRNLRKQCLMNANLESCPPPQPQGLTLPSVRHLMRSAETFQEFPPRSTTPLSSSPSSVASDITTTSSSTTRSRSSSISSASSWMSHGRKNMACGLSSPLSRVCSLTDRPSFGTLTGTESAQRSQPVTVRNSPTRPQSVHPLATKQDINGPTNSEVAAIHGLLSLSTSETPSQSVTPTPERLPEIDTAMALDFYNRSKEHKRKLSKTEPALQSHVRDMLKDKSWSSNVAEDSLLPYFGNATRELQLPTALRKENRRPIATPCNSKRLCSLQHSSSTPTGLSLTEASDHSILLCR
jgi:hypothetical protein